MNTITRAARHTLTLVTMAAAALVVGCAGLQKLQSNPAVQKAEQDGWNIALNAAETYATGGKLDAAWAAPLALNSVSDLVKATSSNEQAAALIDATTQQLVNDPHFSHLGKDFANAFIAANPKTPAQKSAVVVALATGASNGLTSASTPQP
jgi:hypothetical protein